jgi:hypothetical protein
MCLVCHDTLWWRERALVRWIVVGLYQTPQIHRLLVVRIWFGELVRLRRRKLSLSLGSRSRVDSPLPGAPLITIDCLWPFHSAVRVNPLIGGCPCWMSMYLVVWEILGTNQRVVRILKIPPPAEASANFSPLIFSLSHITFVLNRSAYEKLWIVSMRAHQGENRMRTISIK